MLEFSCAVIEARLRDRLRLAQGLVYSVSALTSFALSPPLDPATPHAQLRGHLFVSLSCGPGDLGRLEADVLAEVRHSAFVRPPPHCRNHSPSRFPHSHYLTIYAGFSRHYAPLIPLSIFHRWSHLLKSP